MMSDSDDTDDLLKIPPDFFVVYSDEHSEYSSNPVLVSELIDHIQLLESRISAIESKGNSNNLLNISRELQLDSVMSYRQTLPRTKFSVSQTSNIQKFPTNHSQCSSLPSTPSIRQQQYHTNKTLHSIKLPGNDQNNEFTNPKLQNKHDNLKLFSEPLFLHTTFQNKNIFHVGNGFSEKNSQSSVNTCENITHNNTFSSLPLINPSSTSANNFISNIKPVDTMNLSEIDVFLGEIDINDKNLMTKNGNHLIERDDGDKKKIIEQGLKFSNNDYLSDCDRRKDLHDYSFFNDTSFSSFDENKFMIECKTLSPTFNHDLNDSKINIAEQRNQEEIDKIISNNQQRKTEYLSNNTEICVVNKKDNILQHFNTSIASRCNDEFTRSQTLSTVSVPQINQNITNSKSLTSIYKTLDNVSISNTLDNAAKKSEASNNENNGNYFIEQASVNIVNSVDSRNQRSQCLPTLSDLWNNDSKKSSEEQLRCELKDEKIRREHCEHFIEDLKKKLFESKEKLAVAVRLDNEKNSFICQIQLLHKKTKQKLCELESDRDNLDKLLKSMSYKHQSEVNSCQEQIKSYKEELSKTLNLATGYKKKSDSLIKEKVDLLDCHAKELQNYKSLVQQAETRYEEIKIEYQKLLEKDQQSEENLKAIQQDLHKEKLKNNDVRAEVSVIRKALDRCEADLIILRQEKENLQLKLKEELNRNNILQESKVCLVAAVNEAKESEKLVKNEMKLLTDQQEKLRTDLRDVYQKQVDEVVKAKLQEFQTQLDSAEMIFQNEIETKQLAIAECAALKIKSVIDKHKLEINLIEEKHDEEKKLFEIKAAQATQKAVMLESQLNGYQKSKNKLVEKLHSMMQKQWEQALLIITEGSGDNMSSIQKINVDKLFTLPSETNLDMIPNQYSSLYTEQTKLDCQKSSTFQNLQSHERQNDSFVTLTSHNETPLTSRKETTSDLEKYIKMILDMQKPKEDYTKLKFFNGSPPTNKETSEKQSSLKDINTSNEGNPAWQPLSEISVHDSSEYLSVPQKFSFKGDHKQKPPWK